MKLIVILLVFLGIRATVFSQDKLRDGIYLIDQSGSKQVDPQSGRVLIQFNPYFVEDEPEKYTPVVIYKNEFVAFELTGMPVIQKQEDGDLLLVHLTGNATEKLTEFTAKHIMNNIVVVVDGQALAIYKITEPVKNGVIKVSQCNNQGCVQIYKSLKNTVKS